MASDVATTSPEAQPLRPPAVIVRLLLGALLAGVGAALTLGLGRDQADLALRAGGEEGLLAGVLALTALAVCVLCVYLAGIWLLACVVLLLGPRSGMARPALGMLQILAPGLARRVVVSAALVSTATALGLGPATASQLDDRGGASIGHGIAATTAGHVPDRPAGVAGSLDPPGSDTARPTNGLAALPSLHGTDGGASDEGGSTAEETTPPSESATQHPTTPSAADPTADPGSDTAAQPSLPPLGWGEDQPTLLDAPTSAQGSEAPPAQPPSGEQPGADGPAPSRPEEGQPRTVTVGEDDCLWTITDELLGEGPDDVAAIDAAWPLLYEANRDLIGPDPDQVATGAVLVVPDSLNRSENGAAPTEERP